MQELKKRAQELIDDGEVSRVLGWRIGDLPYNPEPAYFTNKKELEQFVYNDFCGANLSKFLIETAKLEGKTAVFLKPCDTYSFNQLLMEHRIAREKTHIIGVSCNGKLDIEKIKTQGIKGIESIAGTTAKTLYGEKQFDRDEALLERCSVFECSKHKIYDEIIGKQAKEVKILERFAKVEEIEKMNSQEKFAFFQSELSKCIRCNACRNVCPACSCRKCVFDNTKFDSDTKANSTPFEEKLFHIIRAYHVAGRCTDCGECTRVCPQGIPLHLFNRKFIKDINELYGEFEAGADIETKGPLTDFTFDDAEPSIVRERG